MIAPTVKGEAGPAAGFTDSLFPAASWLEIANTNPLGLEAKFAAAYDRYIASDRWKVNSAPARERARGHCERCGRKCEALEVHHLTYERFTHELPTDLIALCPGCHDKADEERRAAWQRQLARWKAEAEQAYQEAGFNGWLRKAKGIEPDEVGDDEEWLREEYDEWARDRDGDDR